MNAIWQQVVFCKLNSNFFQAFLATRYKLVLSCEDLAVFPLISNNVIIEAMISCEVVFLVSIM